MPNLVEGKAFDNDDEAVGDISLKEEYGPAIGDTVKLSGSDKTFKLTGFYGSCQIQCLTSSLYNHQCLPRNPLRKRRYK